MSYSDFTFEKKISSSKLLEEMKSSDFEMIPVAYQLFIIKRKKCQAGYNGGTFLDFKSEIVRAYAFSHLEDHCKVVEHLKSILNR